ncbi:MAG TPA: alkaline phosphatase family protein, partial [Bryobacteraceae bacterium]
MSFGGIKKLTLGAPFILAILLLALPRQAFTQTPKRVVILKVDGLGGDLLYDAMHETDPATGKSRLPWFTHIFAENGTVFENFYTRGLSLSAPSWSMLDTGQHTVIRGNAEYDRYTGEVYDYLNFFPFYLGYARSRYVAMPGVEVLDSAGIPLLIDRFQYSQIYQAFQLFQRGVRWTTLKNVLTSRFSSKVLFSMLEGIQSPSLDSELQKQQELELEDSLMRPNILYLDLFSGDIDHEGHATNDPAVQFNVLRRLDALAGRIWSRIQQSQLAHDTVLAVVSDHGMNNVPGVISQTFSLTDLLNSRDGGAHHVVTNRVQLSDYKLKGLDPLVHRIITPSTASFYLKGEASRYPTAWIDIDGNERAAVHLRNSDLNKIHILLLELARADLPAHTRRAAAALLLATIDKHRAAWTQIVDQLNSEMAELAHAIAARKRAVAERRNKWNSAERANGEDKAARRLDAQLRNWEEEHTAYTA